MTHEDDVEAEDEDVDEERPGSMLDVLARLLENEESAELVLSFRRRFGLFTSDRGIANKSGSVYLIPALQGLNTHSCISGGEPLEVDCTRCLA